MRISDIFAWLEGVEGELEAVLDAQSGAPATASRPSAPPRSRPGGPARTSESSHTSLSSRRKDPERHSTRSGQTPLLRPPSLPAPPAKSCLKSRQFPLSLQDLEQSLRTNIVRNLTRPRRVSFSDLTIVNNARQQPYAMEIVSRRALDLSDLFAMSLPRPPAYY